MYSRGSPFLYPYYKDMFNMDAFSMTILEFILVNIYSYLRMALRVLENGLELRIEYLSNFFGFGSLAFAKHKIY